MKIDSIQTSFVGGEFGPNLLGRTDVAQYANACSLIENWLIRPFGSLVSTPGTEFINACVTGGTTGVVRLLQFTFSQTDSYIIEMGVGYFRFYTNGAVVVSTGTTPYQISHSYAAADIPTIQYCQDNDVIYLTHKNYPPQTLTRMGATNWVLSNFPFTGGPFMTQNVGQVTLTPSTATSGATVSITAQVPTWSAGSLYTPGDIIVSGSTYYICVIQNTGGGDNVVSVSFSSVSIGTSTNGTVTWGLTAPYTANGGTGDVITKYLEMTNWNFSIPTNATITGVLASINEYTSTSNVQDYSIKLIKGGAVGGTDHSASAFWPTSASNVTYGNPGDLWGETLAPSDVNGSGFGVAVAAQINGPLIGFTAIINSASITVYYGTSSFPADLAAGYWQVTTPIFQSGHVGSFWAIGSTTTSATTGLDVQGYVQMTSYVSGTAMTGSVITILSTAGATTNWAEGSWSYVRGWPARCSFFQSRLFMARTNSEPQTVWGSGNFNFTDFAVNGGADDDALNLQLSANQSNDIKWLAPMNDLIAGTYGGEFCISAGVGTGNPLTPASTGVIQQTSWGSEAIIPKRIGNYCYYIQRYFQKLREIYYIWTSANYKSVDKTILSPQVAGGGFIDMAYQQNPDTVVWLVCTNGTLATMTREVDQEVQGWTRQITAGTYSSIASIPSISGAYDEVWVVVNRYINGSNVNYIERFANQVLPTKGDFVTVQMDQLNYVHCGLQYNAFQSTLTPTATSISLFNKGIGGIDSYTELLLSLNNNSLDTSQNSFVVTNSNVTFSNISPVFSGTSYGVFDGTTSSICIADSASLVFGTGNFTIDGWIKPTLTQASYLWFQQNNNAIDQFELFSDGHFSWFFSNSSGTTLAAYSSISLINSNVWQHFALVRSSSTMFLFVNGISHALTVSTAVLSHNLVDVSAPIYIGETGGIGNFYQGSMSELRFSIGTARWTSNFTPPANPYDNGLAAYTPLTTSSSLIITSSSAYFSPSNNTLRIRAVDAYDDSLGEMLITSYASTTMVYGTITTPFNAVSYSAGSWGISANVISGLTYLQSCSVVALGDGTVDYPTKIVSNGTINLSKDYFVVTVGLQAPQTLMTLPKEEGAQRGTAQGKKQRINQIAYKLNNSYLGFYHSGTTGTLQQVVNSASTLYTFSTLYSGVVPNITFSDNYQYGSKILIQNLDPLPIELLSIMPVLETFEGV